jgi:hypothetical protein
LWLVRLTVHSIQAPVKMIPMASQRIKTYAPQLQKGLLRNFKPGQQACILGQQVSSLYGLLRLTVIF